MKLANLVALAVIIGIVCTPAASAGFVDDLIDVIKFYTTSNLEIIYPEYSSHSGDVVSPEMAIQPNIDYATFSSNEYGKIVLTNANDPFTRQYQSAGAMYVRMQYEMMEAGTTFQVNTYRDDGSFDTQSISVVSAGSGNLAMSPNIQGNHDINYYDTNGDGVIKIEIIHPSGSPEMRVYQVDVSQAIDSTIPAPVVEETVTEEDVTENIVDDIVPTDLKDDDSQEETVAPSEVTEKSTGINPVLTIPGFESVFALVGLIAVAWLVRRNEK